MSLDKKSKVSPIAWISPKRLTRIPRQGGVALKPATLQYAKLSTKPHYRQQGRVRKAGTGVTVDVSSEERSLDLPGR